jgi:hypothetical protein
MNDRQSLRSRSLRNTSPEAKPNSIVEQLRGWWRPQDADEQYLAAATDLADLERRMRVLERASDAPVFVTFNH